VVQPVGSVRGRRLLVVDRHANVPGAISGMTPGTVTRRGSGHRDGLTRAGPGEQHRHRRRPSNPPTSPSCHVPNKGWSQQSRSAHLPIHLPSPRVATRDQSHWTRFPPALARSSPHPRLLAPRRRRGPQNRHGPPRPHPAHHHPAIPPHPPQHRRHRTHRTCPRTRAVGRRRRDLRRRTTFVRRLPSAEWRRIYSPYAATH
jgi:hypothetical protein